MHSRHMLAEGRERSGTMRSSVVKVIRFLCRKA